MTSHYCDDETDEYSYCFECEEFRYPICQSHPIIFLKDSKVAPEKLKHSNLSFARLSVPFILEIRPSTIEGAGEGVFAKMQLPANIALGPYSGERLSDPARADLSGYSWQIRNTKGSSSIYVDAKDESRSNYLRFINCSRVEHEQNLVAWQYKGEIYYRSYKSIPADSELLVWYGDNYGSEFAFKQTMLGPMTMSLRARKSDTGFECPTCSKSFSSEVFLKYHKVRVHNSKGR